MVAGSTWHDHRGLHCIRDLSGMGPYKIYEKPMSDYKSYSDFIFYLDPIHISTSNLVRGILILRFLRPMFFSPKSPSKFQRAYLNLDFCMQMNPYS